MRQFLNNILIFVIPAAIFAVIVLIYPPLSFSVVAEENLNFEYSSTSWNFDYNSSASYNFEYSSNASYGFEYSSVSSWDFGCFSGSLSDCSSSAGDTGNTTSNTTSNKDDDSFTFTLLEPLPYAGGPLKENVTLEQYLGWAYRFVLSIAAFLAVLQITIGGVMWIASGANEKTRGEAKSKIESAIWGLVLAFAAYLVLYTINPQLVSFEGNSFFNTEQENRK